MTYVTLINKAGSGVTDVLFKTLPLGTSFTVFFSYSELLDLIQVLSVKVVLALPISLSYTPTHVHAQSWHISNLKELAFKDPSFAWYSVIVSSSSLSAAARLCRNTLHTADTE